MSYFSEKMQGLVVKEVSFEDGTWGMSFMDGAGITVYNPSNIENIADILVGNKISEYIWTKNYVIIMFEGLLSVNISIRDEDFTGPEAFVMRLPDGTYLIERGEE